MKTIKIFLASSEELENDRMAFGNLVRKLDRIYERRGIRVELFEWEDYDAAYNNQRKQDEYNEYIKASDLFLALFHTKAGKFTIEEFDVATEEFRQKAAPKVYVYCKDLQPEEKESPELTEFKNRLFNELGLYWCRYGNRDTMQLHFVMQLQLVESSRIDAFKVDDKGAVTLDGMPVAHMDQLPFAAGNDTYQKMSAELAELPEKIEKARERVKKMPDDEDLRDDLQAKLDRYNQLKDEFAQLQQNLFSTAKMIANLQQQQVSARLRRAIEAFECGNLEKANTLLEENEREGDFLAEQIDRDHKRLHEHIDSLLLETKTLMADVNIPIDDRNKRVAAIYAKADRWATTSDYDKTKYAALLYDYGSFLSDSAHYNDAICIYQRRLALLDELYGIDSFLAASSYNSIGLIYEELGDNQKALEYYLKSNAITSKVLGEECLSVATDYNNIGVVYDNLRDYEKALYYHSKALAIREKFLSMDDPDFAQSFNNIASVYESLDDYDQALEYYFKALSIFKKVLGEEHPSTATVYHNIGLVYYRKRDNSHSLEFYLKAVAIYEKTKGLEHPSTATTYNAIGTVYYQLDDYKKALDYGFRSLAIYEKVFGEEHALIANACVHIGITYRILGDYDKALEYLLRALAIREKVIGVEHPSTIKAYDKVGFTYKKKGNYNQAIDYYAKALALREKVLGEAHQDTVESIMKIGDMYKALGDYDKYFEYYSRAVSIVDKVDELDLDIEQMKEAIEKGPKSNFLKGGFLSRMFGKKK